ncbi:MAG: hypothetical protein ACOCX3_03360 [Chloroflexota bacterium]
MNNFQELPPVKWSLTHPRITAWVILSVGMIALLVIEARDVGLTVGNWIALIVATVLVAGACIWIVSWEDVDEAAPEDAATMEQPAEASSAETLAATAEADVAPPRDENPPDKS